MAAEAGGHNYNTFTYLGLLMARDKADRDSRLAAAS